MSAQDNLALGPSVHPWVSDGAQRIRFGISASALSWPEMHDLAQMAEGLGFDSFWRIDHPMLGHDCWTTLAAVAAMTRTIRLGTYVSCIAYRPPVLLARMATDIDAISKGRLVLGLGSGDMPREFQQLGLAYPAIQERQAALEEAIGIIRPKLAWGDAHVRWKTLPGRWGSASAAAGPAALHPTTHRRRGRAHHPALCRAVCRYVKHSRGELGRGGPTRLLMQATSSRSCSAAVRRLAETPAGVQAKLDRFPKALLAFLEQTVLATTPDEAIKRMQALVDVGFQYFVCTISGNDVETLNLLAQRVIPAIVA
jgi:alkanesulfonate monooxygenase SsuD/methylene tetrahydromethanopterin reductase-like flavin-dependent oxidoreductase (luciferase family)